MASKNISNSDEWRRERVALLFPPDPWHRFVTGLCLLACLRVVWMGLSFLFGWESAGLDELTATNVLCGVAFLVLGIQGCRYLFRQLGLPGFKPRRSS